MNYDDYYVFEIAGDVTNVAVAIDINYGDSEICGFSVIGVFVKNNDESNDEFVERIKNKVRETLDLKCDPHKQYFSLRHVTIEFTTFI